MLIHDTHAHLDYLLKQNPELVIKELLANHEFWIQPGVNIDRDRFCLKNYINQDNMYFMIGGHPGEVNKDFDQSTYMQNQKATINQYKSFLHNKIVAIGEIGLDYREGMDQVIKDKQKVFFDTEIKLSKELELPFVVHCRDAWQDTLTIIENNLPYEKPFLIHCFTGDIDNYNAVIKMGGYVAFGGIVTYNKTEKLQEVLLEANSYVIETDLPWLAPTPNRGKLNMPEYINDTITYIANKKSILPLEVLEVSRSNSLKIFGNAILSHIDK